MGDQRKESGMMNLTSYNTLKEYVEDGRYTIIVGPRNKSLLTRIKELYPEAVVTTSNADGIGGKKLLVDKLAADGLGLKSALPKYKIVDVVYEKFTKQFVEGGNVTVNFSSKGYEEWEQAFNQVVEATEELNCGLDFATNSDVTVISNQYGDSYLVNQSEDEKVKKQ
ncbi:hypothetical protein ACQUEQ_15285 [Enterococcus casseliflavus]|uniref:hypothetical protein n=1 Tax=Enterococcus casseliflavus TaxID=37734 RepID=UPI003D0D6D38